MKELVEISFVCLGNICRSPLAHGVFQNLVTRAGLDNKIIVSSAGTSGWHTGDLPDNRMRLTAQSKGIQLKNRARQFQSKDFDRFDLVMAMDRFNLSELRKLAPKSISEDQLMLFRTFDPKSNGDLDVPDPYYGGERGFETVFQIVERTCPPLLKHIESHLLNAL